MIGVMSTKTLAYWISVNWTLSQTRKTMKFQMRVEQGCVTGHERPMKKETGG